MTVLQKGIIPIYKPRGPSSYDMIRQLKKRFPGEKIGHGGTLDPLAEGILVVAIGKDHTKKLHSVLHNTEKEYEAVIELGSVSETDDAEGPVHTHNTYRPTQEEVRAILQDFVGEIAQVPPRYSAIKLGGKPAYARARKGEEFVVEPKKVTITDIQLVSYTYPDIAVRVTCGSGVYIRSLARDIGERLQTGAYLKALKRTRVGNFTTEDAVVLT